MTTVLYHAEVGGSEKLVLLGVANHEGDGGAYPAVETLARYANIDRRATQRVLRRLEEAGLLSSHRRTGASTVYRVLLQCPENCDRTTNHRLVEVGGGVSTAGVVPTAPGGVVSTAPGGGVSTAGGAVTQPPEPSYNRQINLYTWQQFWEAYPRRYASQQAKLEWAKLTEEEQQLAIVKAEEFAMSEEAENLKYVPYPANWLKAKRFNDEFIPSQVLRYRKEEEEKKAARIAKATAPVEEVVRELPPRCLEDSTMSILKCGHEACRNN